MARRKNATVASEVVKDTTATNESNNAAFTASVKSTKATIAGIYASNINANLLRISLNEEDVAPYYKGDEIVLGKTIVISIGEFTHALRNTICFNDLNFYEEYIEARTIAIDKAIEIRKKSNGKSFVTSKLALISSVLDNIPITIEFVDVPAYGTYVDSLGKEKDNPTTNGEYSHAIILSKITIDDSEFDDADLVSDVKFQFDNWTRRGKAIDKRMDEIIGNQKTIVRPKSLGDKIQEKLNEED